MTTVKDIYTLLASHAPVENKLDFDNVGLLVGRYGAPVQRVLTALDITDDVIEEAVEKGVDLIVSHHPLYFELNRVTDDTWTGERILSLAEHRIAAICMHTNLDAAVGGVNDALLAAVGCRYAGELDPDTKIGRIGVRPEPTGLSEFMTEIKASLRCSGLRYHDAGRPVFKVAVCGGSGGSDLALAHAAGCDTYVTADIKYDPFLEAKHLGINLIDADHFCTENVVVPVLRQWISDAFPAVDTYISEVHRQTAQFF
jgi:dinuclear metal center YbgI/SA1388 family protein